MRIENIYEHNSEELRSRIDKFIDSLQSLQFPGGISVSNISKKWQGDRMPFSFNVAKSFFSTNISGEVLISASKVVLDVNIPKMVSAFVDEGQLKTIIQKKMDDILT